MDTYIDISPQEKRQTPIEADAQIHTDIGKYIVERAGKTEVIVLIRHYFLTGKL